MTDDLKPAPRLDPNCQCICHRMPGFMHVVACCSAPDDLRARGVRFRKLEWQDGDRNGGFYALVPIKNLFSAYYQITQEDYGLATVEFGIHCHEFGGDTIWKGPTAAAKAAAQADYESRILAALEISDE